MSESEREDLQQMKVSLEKFLMLTNDQILDYGLKESDDDFNFLIKKAIQFRDTLLVINQQLEQNPNQ